MAKTVISVEHLSKRYDLGVIGTGTLSRDLNRRWARFRGKTDPYQKVGQVDNGNQDGDSIWALNDVSFQVKQGEALGIIGRNGAGKSTILKILSRVTAPTSGEVKVKGRIGSLLEVGTGFHPELTGRENIHLNGAILGMHRSEIDRKFDEIVEFSGIGRYIDTPVKRFSTGMYVRLAFSVAAFLETEILIIDEVLAVGDVEFQRKCLGKMDYAAKSGRTVLFVSHNMGMINSFCTKAILLDSGKMVFHGFVSEVIAKYHNKGLDKSYSIDFKESEKAENNAMALLLSAKVINKKGEESGEIDIRDPFSIKIVYRIFSDYFKNPFPNFHFFNSKGVCVFISNSNHTSHFKSDNGQGEYEAVCTIPGYLLNNDTYFIDLALTFTTPGIRIGFFKKNALSFIVRDPIDETINEFRGGFSGEIPGAVRPKLDWQIRKII